MNEPLTPIRLLLVEDHNMVREGIKSLISAHDDMKVVGEAVDGRSAFDMIEALKPDLLVLDISMPGMNGLRLMEDLGRKAGAPRVLVLTAFSETAYLRQMLAAGAAGYLLKHAVVDTLIRAIRIVMDGGTYIDPAVAGKVVSSFVGQKKLRGAREGDDLSEREREVLRHVAQGYTNKEIAERLSISVKTVESHKASLMEKLGLSSRAEIVRYALHQGWLEE